MGLEKGMIRCNGCGSFMKFHPKEQQLVCEHCESTLPIKENKKVKKHFLCDSDEVQNKKVKDEKKEVICSSCGANLEGTTKDITIECPYCGGYYVFTLEPENMVYPDGVLPFFIDQNEIKERFRKWIKKRYFAPNKLKHLYQQNKFQGAYLPYWVFDAEATAYYTGLGGVQRSETYEDEKGNKHTRTWIDWFPVSGHVQHKFIDVTVSASEGEENGYTTEVLPFAVSSANVYQEEYLCGFGAKQYQIPLKLGYDRAVHQMIEELKNDARNDILCRYSDAKNIKVDPSFYEEKYRYLLLPVYKTSYFFQGKEYTVFINGQTGNIYGEYPKSIWKILLAILMVALVIYIVYLMSQ